MEVGDANEGMEIYFVAARAMARWLYVNDLERYSKTMGSCKLSQSAL
jgi:hypothetical protein